MEQDMLMSLPLFERALALATIKHAGQQDKIGEPYIMHVINVMERVSSQEEKIIALLHDIIEDTEMTLKDLEKYGFSENIIRSVRLLTREPDEDYMTYIKALSLDSSARHVKLSDLAHNQDPKRKKGEMTKTDQKRQEKYQKAEAYLRHHNG